jgi:polyhydroxyalkanoate synthesis regulator phasin
MLDLLKKNILIGVGLASMTQNKLKEIGKKLAEESKLSEEEGEKFINEILKQAEDTKSSFEKQISSTMEKVMQKIKPPCFCEIEKLRKEIKELKELLEKK